MLLARYAAASPSVAPEPTLIPFALENASSFPTLARRSNQLTVQSQAQFQSLRQELQLAQHPPDLTPLVRGDLQQATRLRDYVANATPVVKQYDTFLVDFVWKMDELGRADDVSAAERTAFSKAWQEKRADIGQLRTVVFDMQSLFGTLGEVADYLADKRPPQSDPIDVLVARARDEYAVLQNSAAETAETPFPHDTPLVVDSVAGLAYPAASMPNVTLPRQITTAQEIAKSCQYPAEAAQKWEGGTTFLRVRLDDNGAISKPAVARSSGYDQLDAAAVKCIESVRFQPATWEGKAQTVVMEYKWTWEVDWGPGNPNQCAELESAADAKTRPAAPDRSSQSTAMICTCWEESGKAGKLQLVESTGSKRLDDGALKLANVRPPTPRPPGHAGCFAYRLKFNLH